jgi:hypothetical protein
MEYPPGLLPNIAAVREFQRYAIAVADAERYWTLRRIREGKDQPKKAPLPPLATPLKDLVDDA